MRYEHEKNSMFLVHYGIPGQKWGVRRFQYENGSYTPEGKERYGSNNEKQGLVRTIAEAINPQLKTKRLEKARKEIEESKLTDRFDENELDRYSKISNGRFRKAVLSAMQKNKDLKYKNAYRQQTLKGVGLSIGLLSAGVLVKSIITKKCPAIVSLFLNKNKQKRVSEIDPNKLDLKSVDYGYGLNDDWSLDMNRPMVSAKNRKWHETMLAPRIDFDKLKKE